MSYQFFIAMSIFGWAVGAMMYKPATNHMHPMMVSAFSTLLYIVLLPLTFVFFKFDKTINSTGIAFSLLGAAFNCLGSLGYFFALRAGGSVGISSILTGMYPALTLILSFLFLGESLSIKNGLGICFAMISFFFLAVK